MVRQQLQQAEQYGVNLLLLLLLASVSVQAESEQAKLP
jgi:hypothetical protein